MNEELFPSNVVVVQALCPIHIGTGEKLSGLDFVRQNGTVTVIAENKLMLWLTSDASGRLASEFVAHTEKRLPIGNFLKEHSQSADALAAYQVADSVSKSTPIRELMPFIKTPQYAPYLPGSSLKGSLRSALLRGALLEQPKLRYAVEQIVDRQAGLRKSASDEIQAQAFVPTQVAPGKRPNYDLNRVLILHDSAPRSSAVLEVVEVQILSHRSDSSLQIKLNRSGEYPMSIFAETIRPKVSLRLGANWQTHLLLGQGYAQELRFHEIRRLMIYLPEYCQAASQEIIAQEINFYHRHGHPLAGWYEAKRDLLLKSTEGVFILPIGWGSGYDAKTITDLLSKATFQLVADKYRNTQGLGRPGNSSANPWLGPSLSPKSRKVVVRANGELEPVGWVAVAFKPPEDGEQDWFSEMRVKEAAQKPAIPLPEISIQPKSVTPPPALKQPDQTSAGQVTKPVAETQSPPPKPAKPPLTEQFTALPNPGDRFRGPVWFTDDDGTIFVEIPGLSADDYAIAVLSSNQVSGRRYKDGVMLTCEVLQIEADPMQANHWLVRCGLD